MFFFIAGFLLFVTVLWFKTTECYKALVDSYEMTRYGVYRLNCEHCGRWETALKSTVRMENSRTCYNYDGKWESKDNPNRPQLLCCCCADNHQEYWDEMWTDYYVSTTGYSPGYEKRSRCKHVVKT